MCGIAGIINFREQEEKRETLIQMVDMLRHRGPDESGIYLSGPAGLGHARLSILDLAGGTQPIHNEDRTVWITYNGEIFNYPELRKTAESRGHRFYTSTDTEVLVHLYEEFGMGMLKMLNGQFALAIWDETEKQLILARDRIGIRPLFYHLQDGRISFASEIKSLFADSRVPRTLDRQTLADIFTCWVPLNGKTAFQDVEQIPAGHYAVYSSDGMRLEKYWDLLPGDQIDGGKTTREWTGELVDLLVDATRIRLRADVPVGAYLSGGIDSTLTSGIVKHNFNNRLRTFSIAFEDADYDERGFQDTAVRELQTDHRMITCTRSMIRSSFPDVVWHAELPLLRTAPVPLFHLSKLVRDNGFKVVLTGEGADELFAGYNIFKETMIRRFWARDPDSSLRPHLLKRLYPYIFTGNNKRAVKYLQGFYRRNLEQTGSEVYSHLPRWANTSQLTQFFVQEEQLSQEPLTTFINRFTEGLPADFRQWSPLTKAQYIEAKLFLSNYLLSSQGDRMAMAHSIEGRYPFLDHRVMSFAMALPPTLLLKGLKEKYIVKKAAKSFVHETIVERAKQPYRAPVANVFFDNRKDNYVNYFLSTEQLNNSGIFNARKVAGLIRKFQADSGARVSERENMALCGILSTQILEHHFIRNYSSIAQNKMHSLSTNKMMVYGSGEENDTAAIYP